MITIVDVILVEDPDARDIPFSGSFSVNGEA